MFKAAEEIGKAERLGFEFCLIKVVVLTDLVDKLFDPIIFFLLVDVIGDQLQIVTI